MPSAQFYKMLNLVLSMINYDPSDPQIAVSAGGAKRFGRRPGRISRFKPIPSSMEFADILDLSSILWLCQIILEER